MTFNEIGIIFCEVSYSEAVAEWVSLKKRPRDGPAIYPHYQLSPQVAEARVQKEFFSKGG